MAGKGKPRGNGQHAVSSKAQQAFLFATRKPFAKRWSMAAGETGPHGNPASKAAYHRLPARKGIRKR